MKTTNFSEFRKHAAAFLDDVENGEALRILRHGKPIADVTPIVKENSPSWKKAPPRLPMSGVSLSNAILQNRKETPR
jgi:antitoxin (DNA-binding transcriptional repressor) of toxin-antitoxin stability system